jgi:hypothetical protein
MRNIRFVICHSFISCLLLVTNIDKAHAEWGDLFKIFTDENTVAEQSLLTNSEIVEGLKAALSKGAKSAIGQLGKTDGFYGQPRFRIPMPDPLQSAEKALRKVGQDEIADDFILTMNRAAERAVPEAATIFSDAIRQMSFADAKMILNGPDDAATNYLRKTGGQQLEEAMLPIVKQATDQVGVTAKYKEVLDNLGFMSNLIDNDSLDIDLYVTNKATDGLFKILADEEKLIRQDPAARTSELLQRVFSSRL